MRRVAALAVVVLGALASVAAAQASTTVGQTGAPILSNAFNGGDELLTQTYVVPAGGGTIVSLNTQSSSCNTTFAGFQQGSYDLQVLRPLGGSQYEVLGDTGNKTDPCDSQLHSYPVSIPVQPGDVLGVYVVTEWVGALSDSTGSFNFEFQSEPAVGDTISVANSFTGTIDESATLTQEPQTKADCMNGGWKNFADANGNPFKNQGDCVSYVATKGKNGGNG